MIFILRKYTSTTPPNTTLASPYTTLASSYTMPVVSNTYSAVPRMAFFMVHNQPK